MNIGGSENQIAGVAKAAVEAYKGQWTPTAYGAWTGVALAVGYFLRQYLPFFKAQGDREGALHAQMQSLIATLTVRIKALEDEVSAERRRHDEEVSEIRRRHDEEVSEVRHRHDEEVRALNNKLDAMQRIIIQWQVSTGRALTMGHDSDVSATVAAMDRAASRHDEDKV